MIRFLIMSVVLNFVRGETNVKHMVKTAMDVALKLKEVTQDKKFTNVEKALVIKEIEKFSAAAIKFVDEIKIPS